MAQVKDDFTPFDDFVPFDDFKPNTITTPNESKVNEPSLLNRIWSGITEAPEFITSRAKQFGTDLTDYNRNITGTKLESQIRGFGAGANDAIASMLSPLNIATMGRGRIARGASGLLMGEGAKDIVLGEDLSEKALGVAELIGGGLGVKKPKIGAVPNQKIAGYLPERTGPRFYEGEAGIGDVELNYPHKLGKEILPDIGPELAASRTVLNPNVNILQKDPKLSWMLPQAMRQPETIPFKNPSGQLRPNPLPETDKWGRIKTDVQKNTERLIVEAAEAKALGIKDTKLTEAIKTNPKIDWFTELWNFGKTAKTSGDVSAALRQGSGLLLYKNYWKNFNKLFTNFGSQAAHDATMQNIVKNKHYDLGQQVKLQTTNLEELTRREEAMMSRIASEGVPWFGKTAQKIYQKTAGKFIHASNRSYTGFLAKLRQDQFSSMVEDAIRMGIDPNKDLTYAKKLADFINTATGRSSLGRFEKNAVELNNILFSPRFLASRIQMLNPKNYVKQPRQIRLGYLRAAAGMSGLWVGTAGLAKLSGLADVSLDPNSADFGKIKIGNTRLDPGQGFQQILVLMSRLRPDVLGGGYFTPTQGDEETYKMGEKFGGQTKLSVAGRFALNKAHPNLNYLLRQWIPNEDPQIKDLWIPMIIDDANTLMQQDPNLLPILIPGALGIGLQIYDEE